MNVSKKYHKCVIGKGITAIRSARQALLAAAALHTIGPLLLLTGVVIPLAISVRT